MRSPLTGSAGSEAREAGKHQDAWIYPVGQQREAPLGDQAGGAIDRDQPGGGSRRYTIVERKRGEVGDHALHARCYHREDCCSQPEGRIGEDRYRRYRRCIACSLYRGRIFGCAIGVKAPVMRVVYDQCRRRHRYRQQYQPEHLKCCAPFEMIEQGLDYHRIDYAPGRHPGNRDADGQAPPPGKPARCCWTMSSERRHSLHRLVVRCPPPRSLLVRRQWLSGLRKRVQTGNSPW